ncbi:MAG: VanZ family protein [Cytophagales bacterium]
MILSQNRKFYFYFLCSFIWFLLIIYLTIFYKSNSNDIIDFPYFDKLVHFSLFFIQSTFITKTYISRNLNSEKLMTKIIFYLLIFCFSVEFIQIYIPYRSFEILDLTSNIIGLLSGAFFVLFLESKI